MNAQKIYMAVFAGIVSVSLIVAFAYVSLFQPKVAAGLGIQNTPSLFFTVSSSTAITVGNIISGNASSTTVLPSSSGRIWAILSNNSQYPIFCNYAGMLGTSTYPALNPSPTGGFIIAASSTWTIGVPNPIFTGAVNCATQGGTSTVFVESNQ